MNSYASVPQGATLDDFVALMAYLIPRCEWKSSQTAHTLAPYFIEEVHEAVEAIEAEDWPEVAEELGDVLSQLAFQLLLGEAQGHFTIEEVVEGVRDKMIRRSPHVFREGSSTPEEIQIEWDAIKAQEKPHRKKAEDGVPLNLPALARAGKLLSRWATAGVPLAIESPPEHDDFGARFLALAEEARVAGVEPEQALREAIRREERRR